MATHNTPDPSHENLPPRQVIADSKGIIRQSEVLENTTFDHDQAREELERLDVAGEIDRFRVGRHVMIRSIGDLYEETKDRSGPRSDKPHSYPYSYVDKS